MNPRSVINKWFAMRLARRLGLDAPNVHRRHVIDACRSSAEARTRLNDWLVFNVLVGNSDAHLKNLGFMVADEGIQLAPFYDLLNVANYGSPAYDQTGWPAHTQLAWPILGEQHFARMNRHLLLEAGAALGLARKTAKRLLEQLRSQVLQEAEALRLEIEAENAQLTKARPELAATLVGEARCLRAVVHTVVREMVGRLAD